MPKKILPATKWEIAVLSKKEGYNHSRIARETGVSRHCVAATLANYQRSGNSDATYLPPRDVKKTATTPQQDAQLIRLCKAEPFLKPRELKARLSLHGVSLTTVKRRLREAGLNGYHAPSKPSLTDNHKAERLRFAMMHLPTNFNMARFPNYEEMELNTNYRFCDWDKVVFSDESMICSSASGGVTWVRRPRNKRWEAKYILDNTSSSRVTCMVWGYITKNGLGELIRLKGRNNARKYQEEVLIKYVKPFMDAHPDLMFQQDNCPIHRAHTNRNWLDEEKIRVLDGWPAKSPDLNLIEQVWHQLKKELEGEMTGFKGAYPKRQDQLWVKVHAAWERLRSKDPPVVKALYRSMGKRIAYVLDKQGASTPY